MIAHRFLPYVADLSVVIERGNIVGTGKLGTSYGYKEILLSFR